MVYTNDTNASSFWNIGGAIRDSVGRIPETYNFVYFNPTTTSVSDASGRCFPAMESIGDQRSTYIDSLTMTRFDSQNLHTPESCKLNAGIKKSGYAWGEYINPSTNYLNPATSSETANQQPGLTFAIYEGYSGKSDSVFADVQTKPIQRVSPNTGVTTDMTNLTTALNGIIIANGPAGGWCNNSGTTQHTFTVEWFGYFKAPYDGNYTFSIASDDDSYLWIGDNAKSGITGLSLISEAFINNGDLHGMVSKSNSITNNNGSIKMDGVSITILTEGTYYPIRIRFCENCGGYDLQLRITDSRGNVYKKNGDHGKTIFYTSPSETYNPGALTKRDVFYSLVENTTEDTKKNLFQCYITDNTSLPFYKQYNNPNIVGVNVAPTVVLWPTEFNPWDTNTAVSAKISAPDKDGQTIFALYNSNNVLVGEPFAKSKTGATTVTISPNGELFFGNTQFTNINDNGKSLPNGYWLSQYQKEKARNKFDFSVLTYPDILTRELTTGQTIKEKNYIRYSSNGCYAFMMNATGKFVVIGNENVCNNVANDESTIYTKKTVGNNYYAYKAVADKKLNKFFIANNDTKNLTNISIRGGGAKLGTNYTEYNGYSSTNVSTNTNKINPRNCKLSCDSDINCNYYYTYTDSNSNNYCLLSTNDTNNNSLSQLPNTFMPLQPNSKSNDQKPIVSTNLYVKNIVNADTTQYMNIIPEIASSNSNDYNTFTIPNTNTNTDETAMESALRGLTLDMTRQASMFDGFKNREGYQNELNGGYKANPPNVISNDINAIYNRSDILSKQIIPLQQEASDYQDLMNTANTNYQNIDNKIKDTVDLRNSMMRDPAYDFKGNTLDYKDKRKGIMDAVVEDSSQMVYGQNSNYILGTMTVATILIIAIIISRD